MQLKRGPLNGNVDIRIRYTLEPVEGATSVVRALDLTLNLPGLQRLAEPLIVRAFRRENTRLLAELKRYVEAKQPGA